MVASYQAFLRFLHSTCLKYRACLEKVMQGHTKCCTCHAESSQISQQTWRSDAPKCNPSQEISALSPDLLTSLMTMSLVLRLPRKMHLCRSSSNVPRLPSFLDVFGNATKPSRFLLTSDKVHNPLHLPRETTSERQKVVRSWGALYILTWICASRHNGAHFFDISTSKSAPKLLCFAHFDFEMCFTPQQRALFRHLNFQKWSKHCPNLVCFVHFDLEMCFAPQRHALIDVTTSTKWSDVAVLCTFWLRNVLRATTACNFSSLIWPAGSAPAALASLLFDPPEQIIGKTLCFAVFLPFRAPGSAFFWDVLFFDLLSFSLLFSDSSHLCFSSVHIVGSLTSKFPPIRYSKIIWYNMI